MDVPAHLTTWTQLTAFTADRDQWRTPVNKLKVKDRRQSKRATPPRKSKHNYKKRADNTTTRFTFTQPTPTIDPQDPQPSVVSDEINPFSIAADTQRTKALQTASTSNISYSFIPKAKGNSNK